MTDKFLPMKPKTAYQLKWTCSTVFLNDEFDQQRGTSWKSLFPYIEKEYNYVV
jgi:hypothetical protein